METFAFYSDVEMRPDIFFKTLSVMDLRALRTACKTIPLLLAIAVPLLKLWRAIYVHWLVQPTVGRKLLIKSY